MKGTAMSDTTGGMTADLTYAITAMTERHFGDHAAICPTAIEPVEGETVTEMILRCLPDLSTAFGGNPVEHIEIRVTRESIERMKRAALAAAKEVPF